MNKQKRPITKIKQSVKHQLNYSYTDNLFFRILIISLLIYLLGWWNLPILVSIGKFVAIMDTASQIFISKITTIVVIVGKLKWVSARIPLDPTLFLSESQYNYGECTFLSMATMLWLSVPFPHILIDIPLWYYFIYKLIALKRQVD